MTVAAKRLIASIGVAVVLVACSRPVSTGVSYTIYQYSCCSHELVATTWHAGERLTIAWTPRPVGATADATAHQVVLKASLIGPFLTKDALKQAISTGSRPPGIRTIAAPPVSVDDRTGAAAMSSIDLPADVLPGFYNLETQVAVPGLTSTGGAIIVVG